jgi:hypothetical protein
MVAEGPTWIKPVLSLDGSKVNGLADFWSQVDTILEAGVFWGRNLDAFNDILRGGFGTPEDGFVVRWNEVGHPGRRSVMPKPLDGSNRCSSSAIRRIAHP